MISTEQLDKAKTKDEKIWQESHRLVRAGFRGKIVLHCDGSKYVKCVEKTEYIVLEG